MKHDEIKQPARPVLRLNLDALDRMKQRWPVIASNAPLAIGTGKQIADALGEDVSDAMARHTGSADYLEACAEPGARRCHLDSSDAGPVADKHRRFARQKLKERAQAGAERPIGGEA